MADISKLKALMDKAKSLGKARTGGGVAGEVVRRATWTPQPSKRNPNPSAQTLVEFAPPDRRPFSMGPGSVLAIAEQHNEGKLDSIIAMLKEHGGTWNKRTKEQLEAVRDHLEEAVTLAVAILEERTKG